MDIPLPMMSEATSQYAEIGRAIEEDVVVEPSQVERGVVVFDLDGTILDDIGLISHVAADVLNQAFQTPPEEARNPLLGHHRDAVRGPAGSALP